MTAIVIITYNSSGVIDECLDACLRIPEASITVVDNNSEDDTVTRARRTGITVIANESNLGFAAAANQGIALAESDAVLILNPDAVPIEGIHFLSEAVYQERVGAAGGQLLGCDGAPQHGFTVRAFPTAWTLGLEMLGLNRLFPWNPVNRRYRLRMGGEKNAEVDQPAGAFLMVNRRAWVEVGGFDERFFPIWFEDVDFCKRLAGAGYKRLYVPAAIARHVGGHSAKAIGWESRQLIWYGSLLRYVGKHCARPAQIALSITLILACLPRMVMGFIVTRSVTPLNVYCKVVRLAGWHLRSEERGAPRPTAGSAVKEKPG